MNKKYKRFGKASKWIETRYSKQYKTRRSIGMALISGMTMASISRCRAIRGASGSKVERASAIAKIVLDTQIAINKTITGFR